MLLLLLGACQVDDAVNLPDNGTNDEFVIGKGVVTFTGYAPLSHKPIRVHYYIPSGGDPATMPVLFVFPGTERNADDYLGAWIPECTQRKVMAFALEFPKSDYASADYIEGALFDGAVERDEKDWSFSLIDPLFLHIRESLGGSQTAYDIWGHSAGAQFVHRFMLFKSSPYLRTGVSANPGWYTLPDCNKSYPYGLKGTSFANENTQRRFFSKKLIVALGKADVVVDSNLNTSAGANAQGANRYARGLYFWEESNRLANQTGTALLWNKLEVPGVGHEYKKMVSASVSLLFP